MNLVTLFGGVLTVSVLCARAEEQAKPLSVCEIIANRLEYNGRLVTVRGEVKFGPHGDWLVPDSKCPYSLVTRGVEWPKEIFLTYPLNQAPDAAYHANFKVDWPAIERAETRVKRIKFNPDIDQLMETYTGRFVTYLDLENRVSPTLPGARRLGFGPAGLDAPAQLVVKSIHDVVVIHAPAR